MDIYNITRTYRPVNLIRLKTGCVITYEYLRNRTYGYKIIHISTIRSVEKELKAFEKELLIPKAGSGIWNGNLGKFWVQPKRCLTPTRPALLAARRGSGNPGEIISHFIIFFIKVDFLNAVGGNQDHVFPTLFFSYPLTFPPVFKFQGQFPLNFPCIYPKDPFRMDLGFLNIGFKSFKVKSASQVAGRL